MTNDNGYFLILLEIVVVVGLLIWCAAYGLTEEGKERARFVAEQGGFHAYVKQQAEKHFSENSEYDCIKRIIKLRQEEEETEKEERRKKEDEKRRRRRRTVIYVPI